MSEDSRDHERLWDRKKKHFKLSNPLSNLRVEIMDYP